jgi:hypothetical protein
MLLIGRASSEDKADPLQANAMTKTVTAECRYESDKSARLFQHRKGFTAYALEPGHHTVLMLNVDERVAGSSVRLGRELVVELKGVPPLMRNLDAETWLVQALYKFGGPELQFESRKASGTLQISSLTAQGVCHGHVKLTFTEPAIDKTSSGSAEVALAF